VPPDHPPARPLRLFPALPCRGEPPVRVSATLPDREELPFRVATTPPGPREPLFCVATTLPGRGEPLFRVATTLPGRGEPLFRVATTLPGRGEPLFRVATTLRRLPRPLFPSTRPLRAPGNSISTRLGGITTCQIKRNSVSRSLVSWSPSASKSRRRIFLHAVTHRWPHHQERLSTTTPRRTNLQRTYRQ